MATGATAIWRVRPFGSNTNGGGYDPGIASPGTDYSQQDSAQVTFNGTTITATTAGVGATITITGYTTAATDVANVVYISGGTNFITGWYSITARAVGTWTLDRNCTTGAGAAMTGAMGGGWADPVTNTIIGLTPASPLVPGNTIYILGSGTPNSSSYVYDYTISANFSASVSGDTTNGHITYANDPSTPGYKAPPDTTGGMPTLRGSQIFDGGSYLKFQGLWLVANGSFDGLILTTNQGMVFGCVLDTAGHDMRALFMGDYSQVIGCEIFSSSSGAAGTTNALDIASRSCVVGNNIHDLRGNGIVLAVWGDFSSNIIAKCGGVGLRLNGASQAGTITFTVMNNTIDGNGSDGITIDDKVTMIGSVIINNIISNHTAGGAYGINATNGTLASNDTIKALIDYNSFYNNTANYNLISAGPHDTALGSNPYVGQATENYTLA